MVVLLLIFLAWPFFSLFYVSFQKTPLGGPSEFIGLGNYEILLNETRFRGNIFSTLQYVIGVLGLSVPFAYLAAVLISSKVRGAGFLRTIFLVPWVIAPVVSAILFRTLTDPHFGPIVALLEQITGQKYLFLVNPRLAVLTIILHSAWRSFPLQMLLIAAGLTAISSELYDSAKIDGAGAWDQFRYITLPLTRAQVFIAMLIISIWTIQDVEGVYSLTGGGPGYATEVTGVRLFKEAFMYFNLGPAATIGVGLVILSIVFMVVYLRMLGRGESK